MSFVQFVPEDSVTKRQAIMLQNFMSGFGTVYSPTGTGFMLQLVDVVDGRHLISGIVHFHLENRTTVQIVAVACTDPCKTDYRQFWGLLDEAGIKVVSVSVLFRNYEEENRGASHVVAWCTSHGMYSTILMSWRRSHWQRWWFTGYDRRHWARQVSFSEEPIFFRSAPFECRGVRLVSSHRSGRVL
jgi:hypothetical protein